MKGTDLYSADAAVLYNAQTTFPAILRAGTLLGVNIHCKKESFLSFPSPNVGKIMLENASQTKERSVEANGRRYHSVTRINRWRQR